MTHAVIRTSPTGPGQKFIGRCSKCGEEGLGLGGALIECPADGIVSDSQALLDILDDDPAAYAKHKEGRNA